MPEPSVPHVGVVSPVHPDLLAWLRARATTHYLPDARQDDLRTGPVADSDVLVLRSNVRLGAGELARLPRLRLVVRAGSGTDNLDLPALGARGVEVVRVGGAASAPAVAELALQATLALLRGIPSATARLRAGRWTKDIGVGGELAGRTVGVWGAGPVGRAVAALFGALRTTVLFARHRAVPSGFAALDPADLAAAASVHVFALPLRPDTAGYIGPDLLARLRDPSYLINVGRWELFDMPRVIDALCRGHLAGVAVDPVDRAHADRAAALSALTAVDGWPLNLQLTPHLGAATGEALRRVADAAMAALDARWDGVTRSTIPIGHTGAQR